MEEEVIVYRALFVHSRFPKRPAGLPAACASDMLPRYVDVVWPRFESTLVQGEEMGL